jgi:hypothetical protein
MPKNNYKCENCNYFTTIKCNYQRHLKTKKHISNEKIKLSKGNQRYPKGNQMVTDGNQMVTGKDKWECPNCHYQFKQRQGLYRHTNKNRCKGHNNTTINNNITNNTNNTNNTNIEKQINNTIIFNINSKEEAEAIKSILTPDVIAKICEPERNGLPRQSYDIIKKIQRLSLKVKEEDEKFFNFRKRNARDNIIDVMENDKFKKVHFKEYNLEDLHKFAKSIIYKCEEEKIEPNKSYDEKLDLICDVLKDYDY